jgi:hypothetical protein
MATAQTAARQNDTQTTDAKSAHTGLLGTAAQYLQIRMVIAEVLGVVELREERVKTTAEREEVLGERANELRIRLHQVHKTEARVHTPRHTNSTVVVSIRIRARTERQELCSYRQEYDRHLPTYPLCTTTGRRDSDMMSITLRNPTESSSASCRVHRPTQQARGQRKGGIEFSVDTKVRCAIYQLGLLNGLDTLPLLLGSDEFNVHQRSGPFASGDKQVISTWESNTCHTGIREMIAMNQSTGSHSHTHVQTITTTTTTTTHANTHTHTYAHTS